MRREGERREEVGEDNYNKARMRARPIPIGHALRPNGFPQPMHYCASDNTRTHSLLSRASLLCFISSTHSAHYPSTLDHRTHNIDT